MAHFEQNESREGTRCICIGYSFSADKPSPCRALLVVDHGGDATRVVSHASLHHSVIAHVSRASVSAAHHRTTANLSDLVIRNRIPVNPVRARGQVNLGLLVDLHHLRTRLTSQCTSPQKRKMPGFLGLASSVCSNLLQYVTQRYSHQRQRPQSRN